MGESLQALFSAWPCGIFLLFVGLCIGSFLNVCIYRLPAGLSIVSPGSHCMACQAPIAWYDNIPVLSYFVLRGRCRRCGATYSARYMLVELVTGLLWFGFWLAYFKLGLRSDAENPELHAAQMPGVYLVYMVLVSALLASGIIDYDRKEIYTSITYLALGVGVVGSAVWPEVQRLGAYGHELVVRTPWDGSDAVIMSLVGAAVGAGLINITRFLGTLAFRKEAMGGGDAYLMAAIGAVLGWEGAVMVFFLAPFIGLPLGIWQLMKAGKDAGGEGEGRSEEVEEVPPKLHWSTFLTSVVGLVLLIAAALLARPEWGTPARGMLVLSLLAFVASMIFLGHEEEAPTEVSSKEAPVSETHEIPYGPALGAAAVIILLIQDWPMRWFGPGLEGLYHAVTG